MSKRLNRKITNLACIFLGLVISLGLSSVLGTTILSNKLDGRTMEAYNLFCTFQRVPFSAEDTVSNTTGERVTTLDLVMIGFPLHFYTYNLTQSEIVDVGWLNMTNTSILAFSSETLKNDTEYVVDYARIVTIYFYGSGDSTFNAVRIERIHEQNWFDGTILSNSKVIELLTGFGIVVASSLFFLPFIEYYIVNPANKKKSQKTTQ